MNSKSDLVSEYGVVIVSGVVLLVFLAAIVVAWLTHNSALDTLLGMAGTNATVAVSFWLGSSRGSQKKDATLANVGAHGPAAPLTTTTTTTP